MKEYLSLEFISGVKNGQKLLNDVREQVNQRENMNLGYKTPAQLWAEARPREVALTDQPTLEATA